MKRRDFCKVVALAPVIPSILFLPKSQAEEKIMPCRGELVKYEDKWDLRTFINSGKLELCAVHDYYVNDVLESKYESTWVYYFPDILLDRIIQLKEWLDDETNGRIVATHLIYKDMGNKNSGFILTHLPTNDKDITTTFSWKSSYDYNRQRDGSFTY